MRQENEIKKRYCREESSQYHKEWPKPNMNKNNIVLATFSQYIQSMLAQVSIKLKGSHLVASHLLALSEVQVDVWLVNVRKYSFAIFLYGSPQL